MAVREVALVALVLLSVTASAGAKPHECDCDHEMPASPLERTVDAAASPGGAVAGAAVAGLGWVGVRRLRGLPLVPPAVAAWTRLGPADVARHPTRARLLSLVRERPGATTATLVTEAGLNEATALHHLEKLERASFVKSVRAGRDRVWFEAGAARPAPAHLAALQAPARRALLDAVARWPGIAQGNLARELGLSKATTSHHVAQLRAAGLLETRREGLRKRCYLAQGACAPSAPQP